MNAGNYNSTLLNDSADWLLKKYLTSPRIIPSDTPSEPTPSYISEKKYKSLSKAAPKEAVINAPQLYAYYKDLYSQGARQSAENTFGLAAALTGGYGNSNASVLAGNAYQRYMEGLYGKLESVKSESKKEELSFAQAAAKQGDYSYLEKLGVDMSDARYNDSLTKAMDSARYGDYSPLEELGVDTTYLRYAQLLDLGKTMAEYGDYSALEALGIDPRIVKDERLMKKAVALAQYGDYSLLGELSGNLERLKSKISVTVQKGAEDAYYYRGYAALVSYLDRQLEYGQINQSEKSRIIKALTGA